MAPAMNTDRHSDDGLRDQDILKVFDYADDSMLTATEVADGLHTHFDSAASVNAVTRRLRHMEVEELVASQEFVGRETSWHARVAPALADDVAASVDDRRDTDRDEFVPLTS